MPSSGSSSRSFSDSRGNSFSGPTYDTRSTFGRSEDSSSAANRSFGGQTAVRQADVVLPSRDSAGSGTASRSSSIGTPTGGVSTDGYSQKAGSVSNNVSQFNRAFRNGNQTVTTDRYYGNNSRSDASAAKLSVDSQNGNSNRVTRDSRSKTQPDASQQPVNGLSNGKGESGSGPSQWNRFVSRDTRTRPTNDKVSDFLSIRRDGVADPTGGPVDSAHSGKFNRDGGQANFGSKPGASVRSANLQNQLTTSKKQGDDAWVTRFGNSNIPSDRSKRIGGIANPRIGNGDQHVTNDKLNKGMQLGDNQKFDKRTIDRNYQEWRKTASDGKHGSGADHRDWSGQWKNGERFVAANDVREHWKQSDRKNLPFAENWWNGQDRRHDDHWNHFAGHHNRPFFWWTWCSAPLLTNWITFEGGAPCFWDYGPGEYICCRNGVVYVNGVWFEPAPIYYQRTVVIAQRAPQWTALEAAQVEWLPLGVFVIARDGVADKNVLVQLAVTRDGVIGGTIFNQLTGQLSQSRARWTRKRSGPFGRMSTTSAPRS